MSPNSQKYLPHPAPPSSREAYDQLCCYTLALRDPSFIHQHVVDAFAAQTADPHTKPITLAFALIGLYLHVEKHFSGRQVQLAHIFLARRKRQWPPFPLPPVRGPLTASDVIVTPAGSLRDKAIHDWSVSVWTAFQASHKTVADLTQTLYFEDSSRNRAT